VKVDRHTHYDWLKADEEYVAAFARAKECAADTLLQEAWFRATQGMRRYKFDPKGNPIMWDNPETGQREHYYEDHRDTKLLILLLKGLRPEEYSEKHMHAHKHDPKHQVNVTSPHILQDMRDLRKRLQEREGLR
jgi:hypothetical protein